MPNGIWYVEPKLDGMRAIWDGNRLRGRNGNEIVNPPEVLDALKRHFAGYSLDGELYGRSWGQSVSVGRTTAKTIRAGSGVELWAFDCLGTPEAGSLMGRPLSARRMALKQLWDSKGDPSLAVRLVEYTEAAPGLRVNDFAEALLKFGFEGVMLKRASSPYLPGVRSPHWLKFKPSSEVDVRVTGAQVGEGRLSGSLGALHVQDERGKSFRVGTGMSDSERQELWQLYQDGELVGRVCTIIYQDDKAIVGRFPKYVRLRGEK
jgi:DNA ligase-1